MALPTTPPTDLLLRGKSKPFPWSQANTTFTAQIYIRWCCFDLSNAPRQSGTTIKAPVVELARQDGGDKLIPLKLRYTHRRVSPPPAKPVVLERKRRGLYALAGGRDAVQRRVLVADDDGLIRTLLRNLFKDESDYELCAEAKNGEEAVALAKLHEPDLILLDFSMPVMNGVAAARELKKIMPNIPIILFTLFPPAATESALGEFSVDRIVPKGEVSHLMTHIRQLAPPLSSSNRMIPELPTAV
jgi:CheY-like chemotaxis protein